MSIEKNRGLDGALAGLNNMRGLMALWIVLGHLGMNMNTAQGPFLMMQRVDLAVVGVFFFLSGYGLEKSLSEKKDYLIRILTVKIPRLFLMTIVQFAVTELCFLIAGFHKETEGIINEYLRNLNWYMWELAVMYLIFFLAHCLFKDVKAYCMALVLALILMIAVYKLQGAYAGCYSGLAFPAGMVICSIKKKAEEYTQDHYIRTLIISMILMVLFGISILLPKDSVISVTGKNLFCVMFAWICAAVFLKINIQSRVLGFLAAMSPEIYLYQFTASSLVSVLLYKVKIYKRGLAFALYSVVLTFAMALVIFGIRKAIEGALKKKG